MSLQEVQLAPGEVLPLPLAGDQLELDLELEPAQASGTRAGLCLRCSPDGLVPEAPAGEEQTVLWVDWQSGQGPGDFTGQVPDGLTGRVTLDRSRSSADPSVDQTPCGGELSFAPGGAVHLHLYLDHSVLEVIANQTAALASRIYPTRPDSAGLSLLAEGSAVRIRRLQAWQMASIWPS